MQNNHKRGKKANNTKNDNKKTHNDHIEYTKLQKRGPKQPLKDAMTKY